MPETVARLTLDRGPRPARVYTLGCRTYCIGRGFGADISVDHGDISRRHAELEIGYESAVIRDLGSKNGVAIDGVRITGEAALEDGARINLGDVELTLEHLGVRLARVLARGGEPTIRRRPPPPRSPTLPPRALIAPGLAVVLFIVLLTLMILHG